MLPSLLILLLPGISTAWSAPIETNYVPGEVLVMYRDSASLAGARKSAADRSLQVVRHFKRLSERRHRVFLHLRSSKATTAEMIAELKKDPTVLAVEPNYIRHFTDMRTPNDARFGSLWGLKNTGQFANTASGTPGDDIRFLPAWGLARPSTNEVVVAVIDSGTDYTHPDLAGNMWTNPGEVEGNSTDDDNNGYVDDVHGYNFADDNADLSDSGFHGTHVAGTIAATGRNNAGVIGVAWKAHIMGLRTSDDGTSLSDSAVLGAIQYATTMKLLGVNVVAINASFGGAGSSGIEQAAIQDAGDAGIVFCAAAGNAAANNDVTPFYPAGYRLSNMIVVAATDQNDNLASFSDYGATTVDLAAPGVNILSTMPLSLTTVTSYVQRASAAYAAAELQYSGRTTGITGVIYDCGLGYPTNFPSQVNGNIALIQRGDLNFSVKVGNAMAAGAIAAIIYNNTTGAINGTLGTPDNWIPATTISQTDGLALLGTLPGTGTVVNAPNAGAAYQYLNGTSMATPHVAGAVAFAAMNFPDETAPQRVQRILANVTPIPGLQGWLITGGRLNLQKIVDTDGNGLPDWWEQFHFNQSTGVDPAVDADSDGLSNLQEFLADTDPVNAGSKLRLTSVARSGTNVSLAWVGGTESRQYLQRKSSLNSTNWITLGTNEPPLSATGSFLDTSATNSSAIYRLQAERP